MADNEATKLRYFATSVDPETKLVTEFFIEPAGAPGPRAGSKHRHLIARYSDGSRDFATGIPADWSDDRILSAIVDWLPPGTPTPTRQQ